jgi:hypothetical protein
MLNRITRKFHTGNLNGESAALHSTVNLALILSEKDEISWTGPTVTALAGVK